MGFMKVKAPNSHNRKRLAVESRRHSSRDDSHMFIIKLPPNMHYYAGPGAKNSIAEQQDKSGHKGNAPSTMASSTPVAAAASAVASAAVATSPVAEASALKANGKKVNGIPLGYTIDTHNALGLDLADCRAGPFWPWPELALSPVDLGRCGQVWT